MFKGVADAGRFIGRGIKRLFTRRPVEVKPLEAIKPETGEVEKIIEQLGYTRTDLLKEDQRLSIKYEGEEYFPKTQADINIKEFIKKQEGLSENELELLDVFFDLKALELQEYQTITNILINHRIFFDSQGGRVDFEGLLNDYFKDVGFKIKIESRFMEQSEKNSVLYETLIEDPVMNQQEKLELLDYVGKAIRGEIIYEEAVESFPESSRQRRYLKSIEYLFKNQIKIPFIELTSDGAIKKSPILAMPLFDATGKFVPTPAIIDNPKILAAIMQKRFLDSLIILLHESSHFIEISGKTELDIVLAEGLSETIELEFLKNQLKAYRIDKPLYDSIIAEELLDKIENIDKYSLGFFTVQYYLAKYPEMKEALYKAENAKDLPYFEEVVNQVKEMLEIKPAEAEPLEELVTIEFEGQTLENMVTGKVKLPGLELDVELPPNMYIRNDGIIRDYNAWAKEMDNLIGIDEKITEEGGRTYFNIAKQEGEGNIAIIGIKSKDAVNDIANLAHESAHVLYRFGLIDALQKEFNKQGFNIDLSKYDNEQTAILSGFLGLHKAGYELSTLTTDAPNLLNELMQSKIPAEAGN